MKPRVGLGWLYAALVGVVCGCASTNQPAPVVDRSSPANPAAAWAANPAVVRPPAGDAGARPEYHTVKKGETLATIALDHGLDYRELAAWNKIADPNRIRVGQLLLLQPPSSATVVTPLAPVAAVE